MRTRLSITWIVALSACAATVAAAPTVAPKRVTVAHRMVQGVAAADTLVSTARWTLPGPDGKGALDSITVNLPDLTRGGVVHAALAPTAVAVEFRQPLPFRDARWDIVAQVCTWRGTGAQKQSCQESAVASFTYVLAAPPSVIGLTVTNTRVP